MASGRLTPRQKMINMMYLVLTALLALNVSKEVLNSFFANYENYEKQNLVVDNNNDDIYDALKTESETKKRVEPFRDIAYSIKPEALNLNSFIQDMKYSLVLRADGEVFLGKHLDEDGEEIEDNMFTESYADLDPADKSKTIVFLNAKDNRHASGEEFNPENKPNLPRVDNQGKSTQLKVSINRFKVLLLEKLKFAKDNDLIPYHNQSELKTLIDEINTTLDIQDGKSYGEQGNKRTWEYHNFYDMPAVAVLNFLASWQSSLKNAESRVLNFLYSNIDASTIKMTGLQAITIPSSKFILKDEEFQSEIFLTAFDKDAKPEILVGDYEFDENNIPIWNGTPIEVSVEKGKGMFTQKGDEVGLGPQEYKGVIKIVQDDGDQYYPFEGEYKVANSSYAISPTQMNVMYHNKTENPISVSVAGYLPEDVIVRCSGGKISPVNKKKGEYSVVVNEKEQKEVIVALSVTTKSGGTKKIGQSKFRVKFAEGNVVTARRDDGKKFPKEQLKNNQFWSSIPGFDFKDIKFFVGGFTVVCIGSQRQEVKVVGNKLNAEAKEAIDKLESGQTVVIQDFIVRQTNMASYIDPKARKQKFLYIVK